ncbi:MAG TPA: transcription antitermination factor NusB [Acidimicrobiales bacterium]|nr:transcription antitermination factor NusB [Acidimicrobiales bacterium]
MPRGTRRAARERALSLLYEAEAKGTDPVDLLASLPAAPDPYVSDLVAGVAARLADIDRLIGEAAIDWTIDRMPAVDRNLLRLAVFELLSRPEVPVGVVISEAVELAKRYSTDESGRFVNGLLAAIVPTVRPGGTIPV